MILPEKFPKMSPCVHSLRTSQELLGEWGQPWKCKERYQVCGPLQLVPHEALSPRKACTSGSETS